jgi:hypothetical protein
LPGIFPPFFLDDETIGFYSRATPTGSNPEGTTFRFSVKTDGTELTLLPAPVILPGSHVVPVFSITPLATNATVDTVSISDKPPVNHDPSGLYTTITEIFAISPDQVLQLTNFGRVD